jgi:hypothetical protein
LQRKRSAFSCSISSSSFIFHLCMMIVNKFEHQKLIFTSSIFIIYHVWARINYYLLKIIFILYIKRCRKYDWIIFKIFILKHMCKNEIKKIFICIRSICFSKNEIFLCIGTDNIMHICNVIIIRTNLLTKIFLFKLRYYFIWIIYRAHFPPRIPLESIDCQRAVVRLCNKIASYS